MKYPKSRFKNVLIFDLEISLDTYDVPKSQTLLDLIYHQLGVENDRQL